MFRFLIWRAMPRMCRSHRVAREAFALIAVTLCCGGILDMRRRIRTSPSYEHDFVSAIILDASLRVSSYGDHRLIDVDKVTARRRFAFFMDQWSTFVQPLPRCRCIHGEKREEPCKWTFCVCCIWKEWSKPSRIASSFAPTPSSIRAPSFELLVIPDPGRPSSFSRCHTHTHTHSLSLHLAFSLSFCCLHAVVGPE